MARYKVSIQVPQVYEIVLEAANKRAVEVLADATDMKEWTAVPIDWDAGVPIQEELVERIKKKK